MYGTGSGVYSTMIDAGDVDQYLITDLINYTPYYIVLSSYDAKGDESPNSTEIVGVPAGTNLPVAYDQSVTTDQNTAITITLVGSDLDTGDVLTYIIKSLPASGFLSEGGTSIVTVPYLLSGDTLTYTPNVGFTGAFSFDFKVNDGVNDSNIATVAVTVTAGCVFPAEIVNVGWTLIGWTCDTPGDPQQIATALGGLVVIFGWDFNVQNWKVYDSSIPAIFNTLTQLTKWYGYWVYYEPTS